MTNRVSMFNQAQMKDQAEKEEAIKAQKRTKPQSEKIFTIRVPKDLWVQMMNVKIKTDKSLNTQVLEALEKYLEE